MNSYNLKMYDDMRADTLVDIKINQSKNFSLKSKSNPNIYFESMCCSVISDDDTHNNNNVISHDVLCHRNYYNSSTNMIDSLVSSSSPSPTTTSSATSLNRLKSASAKSMHNDTFEQEKQRADKMYQNYLRFENVYENEIIDDGIFTITFNGKADLKIKQNESFVCTAVPNGHYLRAKSHSNNFETQNKNDSKLKANSYLNRSIYLPNENDRLYKTWSAATRAKYLKMKGNFIL
jgi:hypothetical protein